MDKTRIKPIIRSGATLGAVLMVLPMAGCAGLDLFDWRSSNQPLPPVEGNVIATSSNRDLPPPAADDPLADIEGQGGTGTDAGDVQ